MQALFCLGDLEPTLRSAGLLQTVFTSGAPATLSLGQIRTNVADLVPGDVFVAYRGVSFDGHQRLADAVHAGAAALIIEDSEAMLVNYARPTFLVSSSRSAWAWLCAKRCGHPEASLNIIGITGTNGKTSTVWLMRELLRLSGLSALSLGTLGNFLGAKDLGGVHTTPDPPALFAALAAAKQEGLQYVLLEVSSHSLSQAKLGPIRFSGAGFTSFSRDHLDYHQTMDAYLHAKLLLLAEYRRPQALALVHASIAALIRAESEGEPWAADLAYYGTETELSAVAAQTKVALQAVTQSPSSGTQLRINGAFGEQCGRVPLFGAPALANFTLALSLAQNALGRPIDPALWSSIRPVPGRLEPVPAFAADQAAVLVDYAHTPDALAQTLSLLRGFTTGRLIVVFGCGGNRDRGKRPLMGAIAARLADVVILTSDNPRTEEPAAIIAEILTGIPASGSLLMQCVDRAAAISLAITTATAGDTVLIAGKGHETYQIIGAERMAFDDRLVASASLRQLSLKRK